MSPDRILAVILIVILGVIEANLVEPSRRNDIFLTKSSDPFLDPYLVAINRVSFNEILQLPQLNDSELLRQIALDVNPLQSSMSRSSFTSFNDPMRNDELENSADMDAEWEEMLIVGPSSINYMGAVMVISSIKDFPLRPNYNYSLIQYPDSFSTTLVQVANDMKRALSGAHTAMDKIRSNMGQMPSLIKTALRLITQAGLSMTKAMLPRTLSNIGRYANESAVLARATLYQFTQLGELLNEVVQSSIYTNAQNEERADQLQKEATLIKENAAHMDATVQHISEEYKASKARLEAAREEYRRAMQNIPGGEWDTHAWHVYAAHRPAVSCSGSWFWRSCKSNREYQFHEYSQEAKWKAEEALKRLNEAEEHSKQLFAVQMNQQNNLITAVNQLTSINLSEMSINETIKVLLDATKQISEVQKQWARLTRFFSKLSVETDQTQQVILENFLGVIADAQLISTVLDPIDKILFTTMLTEAAIEIDRDSHLLFLMAKTYTEVSSRYMEPQVAGISGLLALQSTAEREHYLKNIGTATASIAEQVKDLINDRQNKYEHASHIRQEEYMQFIKHVNELEMTDIPGEIGIGKRR